MTPLIEVRGLEFRYPVAPARGRAFALSGLTFDVRGGEVLGVIGPNSAGKSTLIRLLTKVLEPDGGEIRLQGRPLGALAGADLARAVAVVPQDAPPGLPFTVEQLVLMGRYPHAPRRFFETAGDRAIARRTMAETGVLELAAVALGSLSGGERQRALLARALAQEPRLLILDEPTAHLDLRYQVECAALLRRLNRRSGISIVLVSHDLNLAAELCDRLLLLSGGRLARLGSPVEVLDAGLLAAVYGCEVSVEKNVVTGRPAVQVAWPVEGR